MPAPGREGDVANGRFVEAQLVESGFGRMAAMEIADGPQWVDNRHLSADTRFEAS